MWLSAAKTVLMATTRDQITDFITGQVRNMAAEGMLPLARVNFVA